MTKERIKFLILTDSIANPRTFPVESAVNLESTYPYLIRDFYPDAIFWQLSYGNMTTQDLIDQAIGYLNDWKPDFIIIHAGIVDCRPEAFTEFQKNLINYFTGPFFKYLKKHIYNPNFINKRMICRVSKKSFRMTLKKFKLIFSESKILFIEICAGLGYESARPGVTKRIIEYNEIVKEIYVDDVVSVNKLLMERNGFSADNLHLNKQGHHVLALALQDKINYHIEEVEKSNYEQ